MVSPCLDGSLDELIRDASSDAAAWQRLWVVIEPQLWDMVDRPRFASHLAHTEESRRRIIGAIRDQLLADRCHLLQQFLDARRINQRLGFARWLRTVAKRIGLAYASYDVPAEPARRRSARRIELS
jgi:hypothetical protein